MRAVVLGVNGMTGRAIAAELADAGWQVAGTGRDASRFPVALRERGVGFTVSDRTDPAQLAAALAGGADVVIDCVCYTAEHARGLLALRGGIGSAVVLSSKAVYVDDAGRHSNSAEPPRFAAPVREDQPTLEPDWSGDYDSAAGYGANKVAAERTLLDSGAAVSVLRPSRIHGPGGNPPREWFVVRRLLEGRTRIPLAHAGRTGNHPTAAWNLARLVRSCAQRPGTRILNVADAGTPTADAVVRAIGAALGIAAEPVGLPDDAPVGFGASPWDTWPPFFLDTSAAARLGAALGGYAGTVGPAVLALAALDAHGRAALNESAYFADRFDFALDDAALAFADRR